MAKTKVELATAVLSQMRETGVGETPDADDSDYVEGRYDVKLAEWRDNGLVWWTNTSRTAEEIPLQVFQALVDLMENEVMHRFGRDNPPVERRLREQQLLAPLRRNLSRRPSGEPTTFSSY